MWQALLRNYETDIEQLNKQQKIQVEKAEVAQGLDMKLASKKLKADQVCQLVRTHKFYVCQILEENVNCVVCFHTTQEKEQKQFREALKQEFKLLKQEVDMLPKDIRKETMKRKREEKEIEQTDKVR